jgi:predicted deacylase
MSTELGGGGRINIGALEIGITGVRNVLAYLGIVGDPRTEEPQTRYLNGVDGFSSVSAPFSGIFQPLHKLGDYVDENQAAGILFSIEEVDRVPLELSFKNSGVVLATRNGARVRRGGHVYLVVEEVAREKALELLQS